LQALAAIEQRMAETFKSKPELSGLLGVVHRYSSFGVVPNSSAADYGFFERFKSLASGSTGGNHLSAMPSRGAAPLPSTASSRGARANEAGSEDMEGVPPFLRKLVALLPRKSAIANMDVDFVIRSLVKGTLPPPPVVRTFEPSLEDASTRKRKHEEATLGAQGAPVDAFKQRQSANSKKVKN